MFLAGFYSRSPSEIVKIKPRARRSQTHDSISMRMSHRQSLCQVHAAEIFAARRQNIASGDSLKAVIEHISPRDPRLCNLFKASIIKMLRNKQK